MAKTKQRGGFGILAIASLIGATKAYRVYTVPARVEAQHQKDLLEIKRNLGVGQKAPSQEEQLKESHNALRFYEKVQSLETGMSLAQVDKRLGFPHKEVKEKLAYNLGIEGQKTETKVQFFPQYRWDDPKSISYVVLEFELDHTLKGQLARSYAEHEPQIYFP